MDLKEFYYLVALEQEGSVSKAAQRLFMAQSSLSQFLQQTESELGVKLFLRTGRGIRPTMNGSVFISRLQKIMDEYQRAKNELWDNENLKGGTITFGISSFRGKWMLPEILRRFYQQYPNIKIKVIEENSMRLEDLLLEGGLDLAVVAMPCQKLKDDVRFLRRDEIVLVAHRDHPIMESAKWRQGSLSSPGYWIDLQDAMKFEFILSDYDTILGTTSRELIRKAGAQCSTINDNITAELAFAMASHGLGLAFSYYPYAQLQSDVSPLRIGKDGAFLHLGLACPPGEYHSKGAQALEQIIREIYPSE